MNFNETKKNKWKTNKNENESFYFKIFVLGFQITKESSMLEKYFHLGNFYKFIILTLKQ